MPAIPAAHELRLGQWPTFITSLSSYSFPRLHTTLNKYLFYSCALYMWKIQLSFSYVNEKLIVPT